MASKKKQSPSKAKKAAPRAKPSAKAVKKPARKPAKKVVKGPARKAPPKKVAAKAKKPAPKPAAKKPVAKKPAGTVPSAALDRALQAASVKGLMSRLAPPMQPLVNRLRELMLKSAPDAVEMLQHENPAYYAQGVFARIEPKEREVMVRFLRGSMLPSGAGLKGQGEDRELIVSADDLKTGLLTKLVREAVSLNLRMVGQEPRF
jgi:hypothetical protein